MNFLGTSFTPDIHAVLAQAHFFKKGKYFCDCTKRDYFRLPIGC